MKRRVMIVDDSRLVRVQLEDALAGTDYEGAGLSTNPLAPIFLARSKVSS